MSEILAIDPGTTESAMVIWDGKRVVHRYFEDNKTCLLILSQRWISPIPVLAIEMVACYGMPVGKEVFETCRWIGRFEEIWQNKNKVVICYRKDIKLHLCQSARAKDANIRQALIDRFGVVGTKKNPGPLYGISGHLWSALAVAVYAWGMQEGTK